MVSLPHLFLHLQLQLDDKLVILFFHFYLNYMFIMPFYHVGGAPAAPPLPLSQRAGASRWATALTSSTLDSVLCKVCTVVMVSRLFISMYILAGGPR